MSLTEKLQKSDFVFHFNGLNQLSNPAQSKVIMEKTVAHPTPSSHTAVKANTAKVATEEKEVAPLVSVPEKALGRKAALVHKKDESRPKAKKRSQKPVAVEETKRDLAEKAHRKAKTQDLVNIILKTK